MKQFPIKTVKQIGVSHKEIPRSELSKLTKFKKGGKTDCGCGWKHKMKSGGSTEKDLLKYRLKLDNDPSGSLIQKLVRNIKKSSDLCKITPPVCVGNLGISRINMPQIKSELVPDFVDEYRQKGVKVTRKKMSVGKLKATQREINGEKVLGMLKAVKEKGLDLAKKPVVVSNDDFILDGHHRWAALLVDDPKNKIPTFHINKPIKQILKDAENFKGVQKKSFGRGGQTPAQKEKIAFVMDEFKNGTLKTSYGETVTDRDQAIAIALSEAGVSKK